MGKEYKEFYIKNTNAIIKARVDFRNNIVSVKDINNVNKKKTIYSIYEFFVKLEARAKE